MGVKLQCGIGPLERRIAVRECCHLKFRSRLHWELRRMFLVNIVKPGVYNTAIHHLQDIIHHITAMVLTLRRQGEGGKDICGSIPKHAGKWTAIFVSNRGETVIRRGVSGTIHIAEQSS